MDHVGFGSANDSEERFHPLSIRHNQNNDEEASGLIAEIKLGHLPIQRPGPEEMLRPPMWVNACIFLERFF
jgi:hypothetical protein